MDISTVISLGALLIALMGLLLNGRKESRSDAASTARMEAKLDVANAGVSDIKVDMRGMQNTLQDHAERLIKLDQRCRSNTHRLDRLDGQHSAEND